MYLKDIQLVFRIEVLYTYRNTELGREVSTVLFLNIAI